MGSSWSNCCKSRSCATSDGARACGSASSGAQLPECDSGAAKAAEYNSDGAIASDGARACGSASSGTLLPDYDSGVAKAAEYDSDGAAASDGA